MRHAIAILLPPVGMVLAGKPIAAVACLLLQATLVGWPVASIWALNATVRDRDNQKLSKVETYDGEFLHEHGVRRNLDRGWVVQHTVSSVPRRGIMGFIMLGLFRRRTRFVVTYARSPASDSGTG